MNLGEVDLGGRQTKQAPPQALTGQTAWRQPPRPLISCCRCISSYNSCICVRSECEFPCFEIICNCVFVFVKRVYCIYIYATNIFPGLILFLYTFYDPLVYQQWAYETCHSYEEDKNSACGCQKSLPRIAGPPPLLQDIYVHSYHTQKLKLKFHLFMYHYNVLLH